MEKYINACVEIDKIHAMDPNTELVNGIGYPSELLYSKRLVECLEKFAPDAPEQLKLATRCQHFKRWEIPRNTYPMDKTGYLKWRKALYIYQSEETGKILEKAGYHKIFIDEVKVLIAKKEIKRTANAQTIEDIACLVFIEFYLDEFSKKHNAEKLKLILSKTWDKMSESAQSEALKINLPINLEKIRLGA